MPGHRTENTGAGISESGEQARVLVLLETCFADNIEAEGAVFVAQGHYGKFAIDGVFDLDHLVLGGGDVGDVSDDQASGDLLLDGHAGNGILLLRSEAGDR